MASERRRQRGRLGQCCVAAVRLLTLSILTVALTVADVASAANGKTHTRCSGSQLRLSVQTQGEKTTAWIGVTIRHPQNPCDLTGAMTFKIMRNGQLVRIEGNPLRVPVSTPVDMNGSHLVRADWSNWCGKRPGLSLLVEYMGLATKSTFPTLPVCLDRARPSRLTAIK